VAHVAHLGRPARLTPPLTWLTWLTWPECCNDFPPEFHALRVCEESWDGERTAAE